MDVETGSIIWRENYYLKIKMDKCKLFMNMIKSPLQNVTGESYKNFVSDLQSDIKNVLYDRPTVATSEYFKGKYVKVDDIPTIIDGDTANAIRDYRLFI